MEITKELIKKVKEINSILEISSVTVDPAGDMYKIQSVETLEQQYDIENSDSLEDVITSELEDKDGSCGVYLVPYSENDDYGDTTFVTLRELATQDYELLKLVTIYPKQEEK